MVNIKKQERLCRSCGKSLSSKFELNENLCDDCYDKILTQDIIEFFQLKFNSL